VTLDIAGTVTDQENEVPLSGVTIGLWDILGADKPVVKTTTDAAGHYQLSTLVESCANGNTTLVFDAITANNCYYMDAADSPACTEARQTFDFPLLRHQGVEGCPWTSGLLQTSPPH
jgi:hypothetical protein